jgi:hypothetical protein
MGILVDTSTGKVVDTGDLGNLCEYVNALNEMGVEHNLIVEMCE